MLDTLLRLMRVVLALVVIGVVALMLANCAAAYMADEIPMEPATRAVADEAKAEWVSQVP